MFFSLIFSLSTYFHCWIRIPILIPILDCKPNGYIFKCRTFHTARSQIQIPKPNCQLQKWNWNQGQNRNLPLECKETINGIIISSQHVRYFIGEKCREEAPRRSRQLSRSSLEVPSFNFVVSDHKSFQLKSINACIIFFIIFRQHMPVKWVTFQF